MMIQGPAAQRHLRNQTFLCDLAIAGGGLAGVCCAITAARQGVKVVLAQDRPVLGGNGSSEVRLWVLGATSHMGNNNRWAREAGVVNEILEENLWRNREGNPIIFDTILLEKVVCEPNITLLLNTAVMEVEKNGEDRIGSFSAFCSQNQTMYRVQAPLFCDASGDGILGFLAGAAFRMGAESKEEFGELFAPDQAFGELLGHSIYFYSKDAGRPVRYVAPSFALKDITQIPRYRDFAPHLGGCRLWWIEYGGRLDTVHDTEQIKWELWKVAYGVWDYIKNSGSFADVDNLTLEWMGTIPGKRESRRFEGDYMLSQQDVIEQRRHEDDVSFGGWSVDLHPADGIYSPLHGCTQWHARGIFPIPYRCLYSRNIANLFLAGRIISASHVAFGSTRVMATCAYSAQAVGVAAKLCQREKLLPAQVAMPPHIGQLQLELMRIGQHIPGLKLHDPLNLAHSAKISASSELEISQLPDDGPTLSLDAARAQMLPLASGPAPAVSFIVDAAEACQVRLELRVSERLGGFTPDRLLASKTVDLSAGQGQSVIADFAVQIDQPGYAWYCISANAQARVHCTQRRMTGVLQVRRSSTQRPSENIGVETYDFWLPQRRPDGHNLAITVSPPLKPFAAANVLNGLERPTDAPNAWAAPADNATLTLQWEQPQTIGRIKLVFDNDWDHPMESVLMGHPEDAAPFCVKRFCVRDAGGAVVTGCEDNHQTRREFTFTEPLRTDQLDIQLLQTRGDAPAALFAVGVFEK